MPPEIVLFWKISAVDWLPEGEGWELQDTLRYAPILAAEGVDMLDVSSGGTSRHQKVELGPRYQVKFAKAVKDLKIPNFAVGAVGWIRDGPTVAGVSRRLSHTCSSVTNYEFRSSKMEKQTSVRSQESSCETLTSYSMWLSPLGLRLDGQINTIELRVSRKVTRWTSEG